MGADIHMYIQYKEGENPTTYNGEELWWEYGNGFNPGRNYTMFGILAKVRQWDVKNGYDPRGLPKFPLSWGIQDELFLRIEDRKEYEDEKTCTLDQAKKWGRPIIERDGKPYKTLHPDWHSLSWLTTKELARAYRWYKKETGYSPCLEYKVLLKTMKALEDNGKNEAIVVFWFDN